MLDPYRGTGKYNVLCTFLRPTKNGPTMTYSDVDNIQCWCDDSGFNTIITKIDNRRTEKTEGYLRTKDILATEVDIDWKIIYDGDEYLITGIQRVDNNNQKGMRTNPTITTTFAVRR